MIFENSLHWQSQKITQFEPGFVGGHLALLGINNTKLSIFIAEQQYFF